MRRSGAAGWVLSGLLASGAAHGIERDAHMIDRIGVEAASYDRLDAIGVGVQGETAVLAGLGQWAVVVDLGYGSLTPDDAAKGQYWRAGLGVRHYLRATTSLLVLGGFERYALDQDVDFAIGRIALRQRFTSPRDPVSPFATLSLGYREGDMLSDPQSDDKFAEVVGELGLGCHFMMNDEFALVFEAAVCAAEDTSHGPEISEGFRAAAYMRYDWP